MVFEDAIAAIQATLAPAFLLTGTGVFLNFLQGRFFRAIDRLRALTAELPSATPAHRTLLLNRIAHLRARGVGLRNAIILGVVTIFFTALTMLILIATYASGFQVPGRVPIVTFALGLVAFVGSLALGVKDTLRSYRTVEDELQETLHAASTR